MQDRRRFLILIFLALAAIFVVFWAENSSDRVAVHLIAVILLLFAILIAWRGFRAHDEAEAQSAKRPKLNKNQIIESLTERLNLNYMMLNKAGRIAYMSEALQHNFPYVKLYDHYSNMARSSVFVDGLRAALQGQEVEPFTFETHRRQDRIFEVQTTRLEKSRDFEGGILVKILDRTEERRNDVLRRDFIANASHELRTPLTGILGGLETLSADPDAKTVEHIVPIMTKEATRMKRLLDDLMSLSRIELYEHYTPSEKVNLKTIIADSLRAAENQSTAKNAQITNTVEEDVFVRGDADQLQQVFVNILDNAMAYGGKNVQITISARENPARYKGKIGIAIEDNGQGIARAEIPRLTERFYRVSATESRNKGGTGLGLAIVKHLILRHQGELQIESELGKGSTFTTWLPLLENQ